MKRGYAVMLTLAGVVILLSPFLQLDELPRWNLVGTTIIQLFRTPLGFATMIIGSIVAVGSLVVYVKGLPTVGADTK